MGICACAAVGVMRLWCLVLLRSYHLPKLCESVDDVFECRSASVVIAPTLAQQLNQHGMDGRTRG